MTSHDYLVVMLVIGAVRCVVMLLLCVSITTQMALRGVVLVTMATRPSRAVVMIVIADALLFVRKRVVRLCSPRNNVLFQ